MLFFLGDISLGPKVVGRSWKPRNSSTKGRMQGPQTIQNTEEMVCVPYFKALNSTVTHTQTLIDHGLCTHVLDSLECKCR